MVLELPTLRDGWKTLPWFLCIPPRKWNAVILLHRAGFVLDTCSHISCEISIKVDATPMNN